MPPSISVFLDHAAAPYASARAQWSDASGAHGDVELLSATTLDRALADAGAPVIAWLDISLPPDHALTTSRRAAELLRSGVAAASISPCTPRVSPLGNYAFGPSHDVGSRVLIPPAGAAVFDRGRLMELQAVLSGDAMYGDLDLGWRLALRGLSVVQAEPSAPDARGARGAPGAQGAAGERRAPSAAGAGAGAPGGATQVRQPGYMDQRAGPSARAPRIDHARRLRRATAHQLRALYTCAGDEWLRWALPAALARIIAVAGAHAGLDPRAFDFGAQPPARMELPVETVALLSAVEDFARALPALRTRRDRLQHTRTKRDGEIQALFDGEIVDADWRRAAGDGGTALCRVLGVRNTGTAGARGALGAPSAPGAQGACALGAAGVSIVVVTRLGPTHLPACLESLSALDYPREQVEVIVVDNASAIDPAAVVEQHYPGARVLRQDRNRGFCGGNNVGFNAARHEWVLFLNDDTRVDPQLLRALLETAKTRRAACVSALVLDWNGTHVDFGGAGMNFEARGFQHGVGDPNIAPWAVERPLLFANGAAALVRREAFVAAGGFPNAYFAYYEDLALGWALWLTGEEVWLSPRARVFHRHHGTSSASGSAARLRNCERNALYTLLSHAEDESLGDLLSAALMLSGTRVVLGLGLGGFRADPLSTVDEPRLRASDRVSRTVLTGHIKAELLRRGASKHLGFGRSLRAVGARGLLGTLRSVTHLIRWGGPPPRGDTQNARESYELGSADAATLAAAVEWSANVAEIEVIRARLQSGRRRSDAEVVSRFGENWLDAIPVDPSRQAEYEVTHRAVAEAFSVGRLLAS